MSKFLAHGMSLHGSCFFLWSFTSFTVKNKLIIIVSLAAVDWSWVWKEGAKWNPSPATKNLRWSSVKHTSFLTEILCLLRALPWTIKTKLISKSSKIWWKIVFHSNKDVFTWLKLFFNHLKENNKHLPALQN